MGARGLKLWWYVVVPAANILIEPSPKDSCAAVSLACAVLARRDPGAIMAAFSADHLIGDQPRFIDGVWAIFATLDTRVLQFKPGLLLSPDDCDDLLDRTAVSIAAAREHAV